MVRRRQMLRLLEEGYFRMGGALLKGEEGPAILVNEQGRSPYILICEHASNRLPKALGSLGLTASDLQRHIAWDIGAENVARVLSRLIDAPLILQRYSRLAYDCNRPLEAPDAIPGISETTPIPGNMNLTSADKLARAQEICRPFHAAVAGVLDGRAAEGIKSLVISIHSFTPVYKGKSRKVELGILHDRDASFSSMLIKRFSKVDARLNEPYGPKDGVLHTLNLHAAPRGLKHAMLEIRNDLIASERGQQEWAQRISVPLIQAAAALSGR
ncbi:MAG: N-formylglutamate amidohydrolase [Rhizobiales bacterium]|nr:N-formylglutamate amidohydrolase [Hyphomicrobiales bacterium]